MNNQYQTKLQETLYLQEAPTLDDFLCDSRLG